MCGNVNFDSVSNFLADFYHPAREDVDVDVVLINKKLPDMQFNALLKANKKRLLYIMGTVFNNEDLEKTAMEKAAACIVICDKFAPDPDDEDATNIMRVIAVKNFSPKTRCIIQLLHYQNKAYLININGWDWTLHDQAACFNEVKLGLFAQSCLAPGFSTIMANLLVASEEQPVDRKMARWRQMYLPTTNKVILAETLSPTFAGYLFTDVASILFTRFDLILVAVEDRSYEGGEIHINPDHMRIRPNAIGLFFARSVDHVKMAWIFCLEHHANEYNPEKILLCNCRKSALKKAYSQIGRGGGGGGRGQDQVARRREVGGGRVSPWDENSVAVDVGAGGLEEGGVKRRRRGGHLHQHQQAHHQHHGSNRGGGFPDLLDRALQVDDSGARPGKTKQSLRNWVTHHD